MNSQLWSGINNERHSNMGFSVGITTGFNGKTIFFHSSMHFSSLIWGLRILLMLRTKFSIFRNLVQNFENL